MIGALALAALVQVAVPSPSDTLPVVTLAEALRDAVQLDPDYVRAVGWPQQGAPYGPILTEIEGRSYPA